MRSAVQSRALKATLNTQRLFKSGPPSLLKLQEVFKQRQKAGSMGMMAMKNELFGTAAGDSKVLEYDEFAMLLDRMEVGLEEDEITELFDYFDRDSSGDIGYDEFVRALKGDLPKFSSSIDFGGAHRNTMPSAMKDIKTNTPKFDVDETNEGLESLDAVVQTHGKSRARFLIHDLITQAQKLDVPVREPVVTPFVNSIPTSAEEPYPGDLPLEEKIANIVRWNAAVMVSDANARNHGLGGHIGTFASVCDIWEVLQNHFLRGKAAGGGEGDSIYIQGHVSPGAYSRAFLEGRISLDHLLNFRMECDGNGLSSYPHPRLMPDFWENPTVSMGIGPLQAVHQARLFRYLHLRGLADTSRSRVWAFIGDGEMDESETISAIAVAGRERLNNVVFIVNCNYQRLDGPVRGNSKVIQEFEGLYRGAGWDCIKLIWGGKWNELVEGDVDGKFVDVLENHPDGDCQRLAAKMDGAQIRKELFPGELAERVAHMSDAELLDAYMTPGGHDKQKIYSALSQAQKNCEQGARPTVILVKTLKGHSLKTFVGRNPVHQMKSINHEALMDFRDHLNIPLTNEQIGNKDKEAFCNPGPDSAEVKYVLERRNALGGFLPSRVAPKVTSVVKTPGDALFEKSFGGTRDGQQLSTTKAWGAMLRLLMKEKNFGKRIVPIITDESRTFGLEGFFPEFKIHAPFGQSYTPVDADSLLSYKEAPDGQMMQEGISEAGALCTWIASGTSYASQGCPTLPFFVFYSMFGFQRVGDFIWQGADARARGFLLGATGGRTTLNGEGLQHQDGHSLLIAMTNPACRAYDPAYGYEVAIITQQGINEMWGEDKDVIYYIMLYNEDMPMPPLLDEDKDRVRAGIRRGMYKLKTVGETDLKVRLLGSGCIMKQVTDAADILAQEYGVSSDIWSVVSYGELHNDMNDCLRHNRLNVTEPEKVPYVTECFSDGLELTVACSDYQKALPESIRAAVPGEFEVLGTDGFGRSDTRENLRRFFEIDTESVVCATLAKLSRMGKIDPKIAAEAIGKYGLITGPRIDIAAI
eukprot:TRINITY_DN720_c0_g2_i1.p1 TRINITY_DN720_c0_g2~~TRINITY_DN720_c0_g2_i1.p1  ORF type:complete len:1036 (+),score=371.31 TRINITY_DN720_c0_g2_i1:56-3163(+)